MPPDLVLLSTLIGSNYPCLELIFMVPKVFEPLKFDCTCGRRLYLDQIIGFLCTNMIYKDSAAKVHVCMYVCIGIGVYV